jgi:nucleotide-binding universal stress UspA family protein
MGALGNQLYTMIVAMAVVTTMVMPPTLRWMMARVPLRGEELQRLDKEDAEESESVPRMERALVYLDGSANGRLTATLAGMFAARQQVLTTVLEAPREDDDKVQGRDRLTEAAKAVLQNIAEPTDKEAPAARKPVIEQLVQGRTAQAEDTLEKEAAKGYSIAFVGVGQPISTTVARFDEQLQRLLATFDGPVAILINGEGAGWSPGAPLDILVPTGGSPDARLATEIALTLAGASHGTLTALHVFDPREDTHLLRGRGRRHGISVLVAAHRLGRRRRARRGLTATNPARSRDPAHCAAWPLRLVVLGASLGTRRASSSGRVR